MDVQEIQRQIDITNELAESALKNTKDEGTRQEILYKMGRSMEILQEYMRIATSS